MKKKVSKLNSADSFGNLAGVLVVQKNLDI